MSNVADPKRPYKMYAAMVATFLGGLLAIPNLHPVAAAIIVSLVAAISVYVTGNPIVQAAKKVAAPKPNQDDYLF